MILEGYHRYLACLATEVTPIFTEFKGTDLEAAELVHASGIRRQSSADQRYAAFDQLCEACPEFKEKYEKLKAKADEQQRQGKPLASGGQKVDVLKTKAEAAGVSKSTAKKVEQVKKANPAVVADIAAGKTTANKEVKKLAIGRLQFKKAQPQRRNYLCCEETTVNVKEHDPSQTLVISLTNVEPPSRGSRLDVICRLDRELATDLRNQLGELLTKAPKKVEATITS